MVPVSGFRTPGFRAERSLLDTPSRNRRSGPGSTSRGPTRKGAFAKNCSPEQFLFDEMPPNCFLEQHEHDRNPKEIPLVLAEGSRRLPRADRPGTNRIPPRPGVVRKLQASPRTPVRTRGGEEFLAGRGSRQGAGAGKVAPRAMGRRPPVVFDSDRPYRSSPLRGYASLRPKRLQAFSVFARNSRRSRL